MQEDKKQMIDALAIISFIKGSSCTTLEVCDDPCVCL